MSSTSFGQSLATINYAGSHGTSDAASVLTPNSAISVLTKRQNKKQEQLNNFPNLMALLKEGIIDNFGQPSCKLIALSDYLELEHRQDLSSLTNAWDKFFLRDFSGHAIERWDLQRLGLGQEWESHRWQIIELLRSTGLLSSKFARHRQYDTLIIHGARLEDIMPRLKFIAQFWLMGGRFKKVVVLTGERPLTYDELDQRNWSFLPFKKTYVNQLHTEIELMQYAWGINNIVPDAVRQLPTLWINTPNFKSKDGQIRRGNTEDTINAWLNSDFSPEQSDLGKCIAVANAPLILRQHLVFERKLYELGIKASIETAGLAEEQVGQQLIIYYLREISGLLWELNKLATELKLKAA